MTCQLEADSAPPLDLVLEKSGTEWEIKSPASIIARRVLATKLAEELKQKVKAPVTVDCGPGLYGYSDGDQLTCSAKRSTAKKEGALAVRFAGQGYTWTATGI